MLNDGEQQYRIFNRGSGSIRIRWWHWLFLILMDMLGPFSSDVIIPSLPTIEKELNATTFQTSLLLNLNWVTMGLAAILLGQLSDRVGRRWVVILGLSIFIAGNVYCAEASTFYILLVGRIAQAVGEGSSPLVDAITRDVLDDPIQRMKMIAILSTLRPLCIIASPSVGGLISETIGWRWIFRILTCWGSVCLLLVFFLPETRLKVRGKKFAEPKSRLCRNLCRLFSSRLFLAMIFISMLQLAAIWIFLSTISYILVDYFGFRMAAAGLLMSLGPAVGMIATILTYILVGKVSTILQLRIHWSIGAFLSSAAISFFYFSGLYVEKKNWWMILVTFAMIVFKQFGSGPALRTLGLQDFKDISGLASGINCLFRYTIPVAVSSLVDHYFDGTPRVTLFSIMILEGISIVVFWVMLGAPGLPSHNYLSECEKDPLIG